MSKKHVGGCFFLGHDGRGSRLRCVSGKRGGLGLLFFGSNVFDYLHLNYFFLGYTGVGDNLRRENDILGVGVEANGCSLERCWDELGAWSVGYIEMGVCTRIERCCFWVYSQVCSTDCYSKWASRVPLYCLALDCPDSSLNRPLQPSRLYWLPPQGHSL